MTTASIADPLSLNVSLGERSYPIYIGAGLMDQASAWSRICPGGR